MFNESFSYKPPIAMGNEMLALIIILSIIAILGAIGNSLATFVFYKVRDKTTAQIFILTMSIIDLFTCTVIIPFTIVVEYLRYDIRSDAVCKMYQFLVTSKVPLSAFLMVAIAFDRYFCICHPLRRFVTPFRMKIVILCLSTFACTLGIITCLAYGVYRKAILPSLNHTPESDFSGLNGNKMINWRPIIDDPIPSNDASDVVMSALLDHLKQRNISQMVFSLRNNEPVVYVGICRPNYLILDVRFIFVYQKMYSVLFLLCLIIVAILYGLIFRFIQLRRSRKLQHKLVLCSYMNGDHGFEGTRLTLINGGDEEHGGKDERESPTGENTLKVDQNKNTDRRRASSYVENIFNADKLREETRSSNIKTAMMLFTVTVVFMVAFLPAWLMAHQFIPTHIVVFYMYFSYNVANPCIYAFMNPVFQENMKKLCRRQCA